MFMSLFAAAAIAASGNGVPTVEVVRGELISSAKASAATGEASLNPRAIDLVESDPAIHQWAVRSYDRNGDGWLTLFEAQPAVGGFQDIADEDRDGRVTVREYRAAVDFLRARY